MSWFYLIAFCLVLSAIVTSRAWDGVDSVIAFLLQVAVIVFGVSICVSTEGIRLASEACKADRLVDSYRQADETLARTLVELANGDGMRKAQLEDKVRALAASQTPEAVGEAVRATVESAPALEVAERDAAIRLAIQATRQEQAVIKALYQKLRAIYAEDTLPHTRGYWAVKRSKSHDLPVPASIPNWPVP